jgi:hypothetical protein
MPSDDYEPIKDTLLGQRFHSTDIPRMDAPGVYALFIADPAALPMLAVPPSRLLYVGMTESSLEVRDHFKHRHSGFSTLRRSLGALLKDQLHLQAIPRAPGPSETNTRNYRFPEAGEQRLTAWMEGNLRCSLACVSGDLRSIEQRLIAELEPPLNLTDWSNPQREHLKQLRAICRREAHSNAGTSGGSR